MDAQYDVDSKNRFTQALIRAKEGATKGTSELVGIIITDTMLQAADGTNYKGIGEYHLHYLLTAVISGSDRPDMTNVLDQLIEVLSFPFDLKKKVSANVKMLRAKDAKMATFGFAISKPHTALIILYNIKWQSKRTMAESFAPPYRTSGARTNTTPSTTLHPSSTS